MKAKVIKLLNSKGQIRAVSLDEAKRKFNQTKKAYNIASAPTDGLKIGEWIETLELPVANKIWDDELCDYVEVEEYWGETCDRYGLVFRYKCTEDGFGMDFPCGARFWEEEEMPATVIRLSNSKGKYRDVTLEETKKRFNETRRGLHIFKAPVDELEDGDWIETLELPTDNGVWDDELQDYVFTPEFWGENCDKYAIIHKMVKYKDKWEFASDLGHRNW